MARQMTFTPERMNISMNSAMSMPGSPPYSPAYDVNLNKMNTPPIGNSAVPKGYSRLQFKEGMRTPMNLSRKNARPKAPNAPRKKLVFGASASQKTRKNNRGNRARRVLKKKRT